MIDCLYIDHLTTPLKLIVMIFQIKDDNVIHTEACSTTEIDDEV